MQIEFLAVIAKFKTWRIMHADYRRRPLATFPETISVMVARHFGWTLDRARNVQIGVEFRACWWRSLTARRPTGSGVADRIVGVV
jgi:hypothetical protein